MTWGRLDDGFWCHPKVCKLEELGPQTCAQALALWTMANSWCLRFASETGEISLAAIRRIVPFRTKRAIDALVSVGLWERDGDTLRFHDWTDYQPRNDRGNDATNDTTNAPRNEPRNDTRRPPESLGKVDTPVPVPVKDSFTTTKHHPSLDTPGARAEAEARERNRVIRTARTAYVQAFRDRGLLQEPTQAAEVNEAFATVGTLARQKAGLAEVAQLDTWAAVWLDSGDTEHRTPKAWAAWVNAQCAGGWKRRAAKARGMAPPAPADAFEGGDTRATVESFINVGTA